MNEIEKTPEINLESVLIELRYGLNALDAIHTAMAEGPDDPGDYVDALRCVYDYLKERACALNSIYEHYRAAARAAAERRWRDGKVIYQGYRQ